MFKKFLKVFPFVLIVVLLVAFPVFAQDEPVDIVAPEGLASIIAAISGLIGMSFVQTLKKYTGWDEGKALVATTLTSLVLAIGVVIVNGTVVGMPITLDNISNALGIVFTIATLFYKAFISLPAKAKAKALADKV